MGQPIDTTQNMTFRFFADETGGTSLFEESKDLTVADGVFQTNIGDTGPIPADLAGQELFLEIEIFGDSSPLSPRQRIRIPGVDTNFFQQRVNETCPEGSSIRVISISGTVTCETDDIGGGGGGGIGGSGTVNRVAKFTGTTTLGDSGIFEDALGNLGIGTTNPGQLLDIESDVKAEVSAFTKSDTEQSDFVGRRSRASGNQEVQEHDNLVRFIGRGFDGVRTRKAAEIRFKVDGPPAVDDMPGRMEFRTTPLGSDSPNTHMVIKSTGNVGIGTTDPTSSLHIAGGQLRLEGSQLLVENSQLLLGTGANLSATNLAGVPLDILHLGQAHGLDDFTKIISGGAGVTFFSAGGGSETMTIPDSGNVGIGTTNPKRLLELESTEARVFATTISDDGNSEFRGRRILAAGNGKVLVEDTVVKFSGSGFDGDEFLKLAEIRFKVDGGMADNDMPGRIEFRTTLDGSVSPNTNMVIKNTGNVGIGTVDPEAQLDVRGNTFLGPGTDPASFGAVTIREPDNVDAILGVHSNQGVFQVGWDATEDRGAISVGSGQDIAFITDATGAPGDPWDGTIPKMIINGAGNVGIGTATPAVKLEVEDTSIDAVLLTLRDIDGTCDQNPEAGVLTWSCASDARLKTNIKDARPVLDDLMTLRVRDYTVKASGDELTGLVAQEVREVMPGIVREGSDGYLMVSEKNHWKLVKAIQELKMENDDLQARLDALEGGSGVDVGPVEPMSSGDLPNPWLLFGGLALGGLVLGGLATGLTARRFNGKLPPLE